MLTTLTVLCLPSLKPRKDLIEVRTFKIKKDFQVERYSKAPIFFTYPIQRSPSGSFTNYHVGASGAFRSVHLIYAAGLGRYEFFFVHVVQETISVHGSL